VTGLPASEHIVASIADPGAGPSYSVRALAGALAALGAEVRLHSVRGWRDGGDPVETGVLHTTHRQDLAAVPLLGAACLSRELAAALARSDAAVLHGHGLWLAPNIYPARAARRVGAKWVVSPRGMLSAEAMTFSSAKKRVFWRLFQRRALVAADLIHATGEGEVADIRAAGLVGPVAVIPNGVDLPPPPAAGPRTGPLTILSLGRIHPKKGLDSLVRAWASLEAAWPDWRLRIVGPAELGHDRALIDLAARLGLARCAIEGPLYGDDRLAALRGANLFVLPTLSENFAMTVAEALAAGTPVISTRGAPWAGLETEGCGWWIDHGPAPLAETLALAMSLGRPALAAMGERGRAWMARDFAWSRIAGDMLQAYAWAAHGGAPPPFLRLCEHG
jgi:glycosyltransferase involved in cell wall biosynthesis